MKFKGDNGNPNPNYQKPVHTSKIHTTGNMKIAYALLTASKTEINRKLFSILLFKKVSKKLRIDRGNVPDFFFN
jgi:hypothetical protein